MDDSAKSAPPFPSCHSPAPAQTPACSRTSPDPPAAKLHHKQTPRICNRVCDEFSGTATNASRPSGREPSQSFPAAPDHPPPAHPAAVLPPAEPPPAPKSAPASLSPATAAPAAATQNEPPPPAAEESTIP